jgi:transcriptional regulator with XRE-family HTH domain
MRKSLDKGDSQPLVVSEVLKRLMLERGLSVADVMAGTGLTANPIYDLLNNKIKSPRYNTIKKIADFFEVSPSFLLYGEEFDFFDSRQPLIAAQIAKEVNAYIQRSQAPSYLSDARKSELTRKYLNDDEPAVFLLGSIEKRGPILPYQMDRILEALDVLDRISKKEETEEQPTE